MVIERALEKLKQAQAAKTGTASTASRPRATVSHPARRESDSPAPQMAAQIPAFPVLACDEAIAEERRVMLPTSPLAENAPASAAYRMLRTRFLQKLRSNRWTTLAITSPGASEGKSVTALNLALSLARDRTSHVFLLDLDMRNPSICAYLGVTPPRNLLEYFTGEGEPADVFFSIGVQNLYLAGSTLQTPLASELLAGERFEEIIAYIKSVAPNPIIIIDLPPLLVTDEALMIAPRVDATALVVSEGRTRRDSLLRTRQLLAEFTFAGVILNRSHERFGADAYYGYHSNYGERKA
ncbi:MAG: CpsD/CapB family tyrosine-protein kinase [Gammaproteobacteria bacterium]